MMVPTLRDWGSPVAGMDGDAYMCPSFITIRDGSISWNVIYIISINLSICLLYKISIPIDHLIFSLYYLQTIDKYNIYKKIIQNYKI